MAARVHGPPRRAPCEALKADGWTTTPIHALIFAA